jgi:hypothetical protein
MSITKKELIKEYVKAIQGDEAAIFAGAGLSVSSGFVNWKELLREIAESIELNVDEEMDLVALAQYYENERNRGKLNQVLVNEFAKKATITKNHELIASMPIRYFWTTNYDTLIEKALEKRGKTYDAKISIQNLALSRFKCEAIVYKMHGDISQPHETILTKNDYETFESKKSLFSLALKGDLVTKTFLFIGYSFNDPNLHYILSKIKSLLDTDGRPHYCLMRKVKRNDYIKDGLSEEEIDKKFEYGKKQQKHKIRDLQRYSIYTYLVEEYQEITDILAEIHELVKRKTIFISGAAHEYEPWDKSEALDFIYNLSKELSKNGYRIVTGFGLGIGSSVINGVLENMVESGNSNLEDILLMRPFPQPEKKEEINEIRRRWTVYRNEMIAHAGIVIFVFGNKLTDAGIVNSDGMLEEFEISNKYALIPIPIGATNHQAFEISKIVINDFNKFYPGFEALKTDLQILQKRPNETKILINKVLHIIKILNNAF